MLPLLDGLEAVVWHWIRSLRQTMLHSCISSGLVVALVVGVEQHLCPPRNVTT